MSLSAEVLVPYLPALAVRRWIAAGEAAPAGMAVHLAGAALFADVVGSTALAARVAERGAGGAERLGAILSGAFDQLIEVIAAHGGDVVSFAGDALLAFWPAEPPNDLAAVAAQAAVCALEVQGRVAGLELADGIRLALHIGIGAGPAAVWVLEGTAGHCECVVAGACVRQSASAHERAEGGEVVLAPEAWELIRGRGAGVVLADGFVRLERIDGAVPRAPLPPVEVPAGAAAALRAWVPLPARDRLAAGHTGWLDELRRATIVFVGLADLDLAAAHDAGVRVIDALREVIARHDGCVLRIGVDDKGTTLLAAFGVPPFTHPDDPARALRAALEMHALLRQTERRGGFGVTTGRVFCGELGGARRRTYTAIGQAVHLAARLMETVGVGILTDEATVQAARGEIICERAGALAVRGAPTPVPVYRVLTAAPAARRRAPVLIGRRGERALLGERLEMLVRGEHAGVVLIEGEAGIGKSCLVEDLRARAARAPVRVLESAADPTDQAMPYQAWRPVLARLLSVDGPADDPAARRARAAERIATLAERARRAAPEEAEPLEQLAPLLGTVLPLDWPETEATARMSAEARADTVRWLLARLLVGAAAEMPLLLVIEDAHWLDSASWALLRLVVDLVRPALVVVTARPPGDDAPAEYHQLRQARETTHLALGGMADEEIAAVAARRLGAASLPEPAAALITARAEGHPLYAEELALALRDAGLIVVEQGLCRPGSGVTDPRMVDLPPTIQGIVTSRIDHLPPRAQLALKVASVIGREFALRTLRDIYPVPGESIYLPEALELLERLDLIHREPRAGEPMYRFKHALTRDAAYELLLFAQRRALHRAVATWYEREHAADLTPFSSLLAYHWTSALGTPTEDPAAAVRAITFLEKAGEQAAQAFADAEVVRLLGEALRLDAALGHAAPARRARWERLVGEAWFRLGDFGAAREHFTRALALLGRPAPAALGARVGHLLIQTTRQALHRARPGRFIGRAPPARQADLRAAARIHDHLALIAFIGADRLGALGGYLQALNLAEQAGPSPEAVMSGTAMGIVAGTLGLTGLAEGYFRRALAIAEAINDTESRARGWFSRGYYLAGRARWREALEAFDRAAALYEQLGDRRWVETTLLNRANAVGYQGEFAAARALYALVEDRARQRGDLQAEAWALVGQANMALMLEGADAALAVIARLLDRIGGRFERIADPGSEIDARGIQALALARRGDWRAVRTAVEETIRLIERTAMPIYHARTGYEHATAAALQAWEALAAAAPGHVPFFRALVGRGLRAQADFARLFPMGEPQLWLWRGTWAWLGGQAGVARQHWERALESARRLGMRYEEGLAHLEIGRHLAPGDPGRTVHLAAAVRRFAELGTPDELARARAALGGPA